MTSGSSPVVLFAAGVTAVTRNVVEPPPPMPLDQKQVVRTLLAERDKLFAYVWSIVRDTHLADDVFQEVTLLAIERREEINDPTHLMGWARKTARFKALEAMRDKQATPMTLSEQTLELLDTHWQTHDIEDTNEVVDALRLCLDKLTDRSRSLVQMKYVDGLTGHKMAEQLNVKVDTIYKSLSRAHAALGECVRAQIGRADA